VSDGTAVGVASATGVEDGVAAGVVEAAGGVEVSGAGSSFLPQPKTKQVAASALKSASLFMEVLVIGGQGSQADPKELTLNRRSPVGQERQAFTITSLTILPF
jgi:hypothetical protein